ncbi:MAG: hypothetical protein JWN79_476 [Gemmatimonadetes bacterium]|jgi:hypothetical protein|nr:hypothetical protein [Gemmatimonadota bacterium]
MADETSGRARDQRDDETRGDDTGARDAEGAERDTDAGHRLSRLEDYEVDDGYPDIRGWPVRGSNGREIGVVGDLLVDTDLLEVAAVDVHVGVGAAGVRGNVIGAARVPIESVQIRPDRYIVIDVDLIPCEDVVELAGDGGGTARRVPCGQIGIRRRTESERAARPADAEVVRHTVEGSDAASSAEPRQGSPVARPSAGDSVRDR